jgi:ribonuclease HII
MPWLIGIDEAGYGPNLGPMVQSSVPVFVPEEEPGLWESLAKVVRRAHDFDDGRLLIDDSKKVNEGANGFSRLERGVLAALAEEAVLPLSLGDFLRRYAIVESHSELLREPWFDVTVVMPDEAGLEIVLKAGKSLHHGLTRNGLKLGPIRGVVTPAPRFNVLLDKWKNKSAVLAAGVISLLQECRKLPENEPLIYSVDKLGGRHFYAAMIAEAFPDGWVIAEREGPEICSYKVIGLDREIRLVFQPRADGTHFTVALASMVSKYLREVFMRQFNRYWQTHVPGIKPTAGYPADAGRFMRQIREKARSLGFEETAIWRIK